MPKVKKSKLKLVGEDGNAFSILGRAIRAAKQAGWSQEEIDAYLDDAKSGDYNNLLRSTMERFDVQAPRRSWGSTYLGRTPEYAEMKSQVNELFRQLRAARVSDKQIVARQDFMCCGSCAAAAMPDGREYVAYHHQDTERFRERGTLYLLYGSWWDKENDPDSIQHKDRILRLGRLIEQIARTLGLVVTWNGETSTRILLQHPSRDKE